MYLALSKTLLLRKNNPTQLLHKDNPVSSGDFGIALASNLTHNSIFLNFFGCRVVRSIFMSVNVF